MSDTSQGDGWWKASDGKWYPPKERDDPPAPGWWFASDGKWYPPRGDTAEPRKSSTGARATPPSAGTTPANGTKKTPATKPAAKKPATKTPAPASKKAATKKSDKTSTKDEAHPPEIDPSTPTIAPAQKLPVGRERPNLTEGLDPIDQMKRRDTASKQDASVLAPMRAAAAGRALVSLQAQIDAEVAAQADEQREAAKFPPVATPSGARTKAGTAAANGKAKATPPERAKTAQKAGAGASTKQGSLLEVKPSALSTDVEHIGERLVIFDDRVELRDRSDHVRQVIAGDEIADVVVHRKLTGAVLSIESVTGPAIVARGLRPDQADAARNLIMRKTRPVGPVDRSSRPSSTGPAKTAAVAPSTSPSEPVRPGTGTRPHRPVDEADLLRKLGDLHRAGVLTDEEFEAKIELVGRLVRGERLSPSPS